MPIGLRNLNPLKLKKEQKSLISPNPSKDLSNCIAGF